MLFGWQEQVVYLYIAHFHDLIAVRIVLQQLLSKAGERLPLSPSGFSHRAATDLHSMVFLPYIPSLCKGGFVYISAGAWLSPEKISRRG